MANIPLPEGLAQDMMDSLVYLRKHIRAEAAAHSEESGIDKDKLAFEFSLHLLYSHETLDRLIEEEEGG